MQAGLYTVFAESADGGNPAGVVLEADALDEAAMQRAASEVGVPTTVFVRGFTGDPEPRATVSFFTPAMEVAMCGHATIAAMTALVETGRLDPGTGTRVRLHTLRSTTDVTVRPGGPHSGGRPLVEVALFPPRFREVELDRARVERVLGDVETDASLPLAVGYAGLWHVFVGFPAIDDLARLEPDWKQLNVLCRELGVDTLAAFATTADRDGCYRMRDLCGAIGNREEPASGTTSGALVAYLVRCGVLPERGPLEVDVRMGYELGRPSRVRVRREFDAQGAPRLSVFGSAEILSEVLA